MRIRGAFALAILTSVVMLCLWINGLGGLPRRLLPDSDGAQTERFSYKTESLPYKRASDRLNSESDSQPPVATLRELIHWDSSQGKLVTFVDGVNGIEISANKARTIEFRTRKNLPSTIKFKFYYNALQLERPEHNQEIHLIVSWGGYETTNHVIDFGTEGTQIVRVFPTHNFFARIILNGKPYTETVRIGVGSVRNLSQTVKAGPSDDGENWTSILSAARGYAPDSRSILLNKHGEIATYSPDPTLQVYHTGYINDRGKEATTIRQNQLAIINLRESTGILIIPVINNRPLKIFLAAATIKSIQGASTLVRRTTNKIGMLNELPHWDLVLTCSLNDLKFITVNLWTTIDGVTYAATLIMDAENIHDTTVYRTELIPVSGSVLIMTVSGIPIPDTVITAGDQHYGVSDSDGKIYIPESVWAILKKRSLEGYTSDPRAISGRVSFDHNNLILPTGVTVELRVADLLASHNAEFAKLHIFTDLYGDQLYGYPALVDFEDRFLGEKSNGCTRTSSGWDFTFNLNLSAREILFFRLREGELAKATVQINNEEFPLSKESFEPFVRISKAPR